MTEPRSGAPAITISAGPVEAVEFARFGAVLAPPPTIGERAHFGAWLEPVPGRALHSHINRVEPVTLPARVVEVECHPHAAQLFLPIDVSRYLVTVLPSDATGAPDPAAARSFVVPGSLGVVYAPGVWHTGISPLDREGSFAVLMWRSGHDDDVFVEIPPIDIVGGGE